MKKIKTKLSLTGSTLCLLFLAGCGIEIAIEGDAIGGSVKAIDNSISCFYFDSPCNRAYDDERKFITLEAQIRDDLFDGNTRFAGWEPQHLCEERDFRTAKRCTVALERDETTYITANFSSFYALVDDTRDPTWDELGYTEQGTYQEGEDGSKIDVTNELVESLPEGTNHSIKGWAVLKMPTNKSVDPDNITGWSRWYQEDGATRIFRTFPNELNVDQAGHRFPRFSYNAAASVEITAAVKYPFPSNYGDQEVRRDWFGVITVVKPPAPDYSTTLINFVSEQLTGPSSRYGESIYYARLKTDSNGVLSVVYKVHGKDENTYYPYGDSDSQLLKRIQVSTFYRQGKLHFRIYRTTDDGQTIDGKPFVVDFKARGDQRFHQSWGLIPDNAGTNKGLPSPVTQLISISNLRIKESRVD